MKKIGIVGGVAWRSTLDYYAGICRLAEERSHEQRVADPVVTPPMCIESLDLARAVALLPEDDTGDWAPFDAYHRDALMRLARSGADVALIASHTPHHRFDAISSGIPIPVLNIFDASADLARESGASEVLIVGTTITMTSRHIRQAFLRAGVNAYAPPQISFPRIGALISDLQRGNAHEGRAELAAIIAGAANAGARGSETVCLACTELGLAFGDGVRIAKRQMGGVTYLDSTAAHIETAFALAFS